jgi:peptidoglycan/xylan/chitin deacetylase (PgdA/CDA1 family)
MLSWDEINKLVEAGAEIGGHTMTHPALDRLSPADVASELFCSKELTEKRTGRLVKSFSYPYGIYNSEVREEVMKYYESAVTTETGVNYPGIDNYLLKRIGIEPGISLTHLKLRILRIRIRSRYT